MTNKLNCIIPTSANVRNNVLMNELRFTGLLCSFTKANNIPLFILGDPGADSGDEGKSKRAEKYGTKKSKERREEPPGTLSYQTSSKRSPPFRLLIGARKRLCFSDQSEARTVPTVFLRAIFSRPLRLSLAPTVCP